MRSTRRSLVLISAAPLGINHEANARRRASRKRLERTRVAPTDPLLSGHVPRGSVRACTIASARVRVWARGRVRERVRVLR
eukprot:6063193-Pleurochrysis_carterae.AAC.2